MVKVGLTGNIGSGKTFVANRLRELGCFVLHADKLGHQALTTPSVAYFQTVAAFGTGILNPDYTIDRRKLGNIVFADSAKLARLDEIVHPEVERICADLVQQAQPKIFVYEVAILFEANLADRFDVIVAADCPEEIRIARAMARDCASREQVMARMDRQQALEHNRERIDHIIDTSVSEDETTKAVWSLYAALTEKYVTTN